MDPRSASQGLNEFVNEEDNNINPIDVNIVSLILEDFTASPSTLEDDKVVF